MFDRLALLEEHLLIGSTLVEGSTLSEAEAREVLAGRTVNGHPVQELRELVAYRQAVEWLGKQLLASPYLSHDLLLGFHEILMQGSSEAGQYKASANHTYRIDGKRHSFTSPALVVEALDDWLLDFNRYVQGIETRPVSKASRLYFDFEHIHPFADGNGRVGRLMIAYWLAHAADLAFCFYARDKVPHLLALQAADDDDMQPLHDFFAQRCRSFDAFR